MTSGPPPPPPPQTLPSDELEAGEQEHEHNAASGSGADALDAAAASSALADLLSRHRPAATTNRSASSPSGLGPSTPPRAGPFAADSDALMSSSPAQIPPTQIHFTSTTISPSPPLLGSPAGPSTTAQRTSSASEDHRRDQHSSPAGGGLRIQTDVPPAAVPARSDSLNSNSNLFVGAPGSGRAALASLQRKASSSSLKPVTRTPSLTNALSTSLGSASAASSAWPSPIISAMGGLTPLPSPLLSSDSPGPWRRLARPSSRDAPAVTTIMSESVLVTSTGESIGAALANQAKRKQYVALATGSADGRAQDAQDAQDGEGQGQRPGQQAHMRNRSVSEYSPDPMAIPKRMATVSGSHIKVGTGPDDVQPSYESSHMRREPHLSGARGLTPIEKPPTPPPSESSMSVHDSSASNAGSAAEAKPWHECFEAQGRQDRKRRRWRAVKMLGQGTFSRVMLATSQITPPDEEGGGPERPGSRGAGQLTPEPQSQLDRRTLVAVKVCEHGPRGGASEDRIEMSLKRELEIMQSISHPSLVHLKAWSIEPSRAILVLSHCPGGDLFDVASAHRDLLSPVLLRRIFSEVVGAVSYLHERRIVHRDIKLENVLVNLTPAELADPSVDWLSYPYSVTTLTDLGLSRRIADDEMLETRCGSDDYAAPEVIMGQPYNGRATDAWSLGVLLYALLESRLPFDPPPGTSDAHRMRSRTSHRIARVEWRWVEYAGDEGEHEGDVARFEARGLLGAMEITEGLLKRSRSRWSVEQVAGTEWVRDGIRVEGGIRFRDEEEGAEVL